MSPSWSVGRIVQNGQHAASVLRRGTAAKRLRVCLASRLQWRGAQIHEGDRPRLIVFGVQLQCLGFPRFENPPRGTVSLWSQHRWSPLTQGWNSVLEFTPGAFFRTRASIAVYRDDSSYLECRFPVESFDLRRVVRVWTCAMGVAARVSGRGGRRNHRSAERPSRRRE